MPDDFEKFVAAQQPVIDAVRAELRAGRKRTHWMWFIFPQLAWLGSSRLAQYYALASLSEARAYLAHPVLGPRLVECTALVNAAQGRTLVEIFGTPDDLKFRSCITLFARATPEQPVFHAALDRYCGGTPDPVTLAMLRRDM